MSARPRLTRHQREVYDRLIRLSNGDRWTPARFLGSRGAMEHLVEKGYAERRTSFGPRGGEHHSYRPADAEAARVAFAESVRARAEEQAGRFTGRRETIGYRLLLPLVAWELADGAGWVWEDRIYGSLDAARKAAAELEEAR